MPKIHFSSQSRKLLLLLKEIRLEAGYSQIELAKRLDKPQSFVSKYESGERRLNFLEIREICFACGLSMEEFSRRYEEFLDEA